MYTHTHTRTHVRLWREKNGIADYVAMYLKQTNCNNENNSIEIEEKKNKNERWTRKAIICRMNHTKRLFTSGNIGTWMHTPTKKTSGFWWPNYILTAHQSQTKSIQWKRLVTNENCIMYEWIRTNIDVCMNFYVCGKLITHPWMHRVQ